MSGNRTWIELGRPAVINERVLGTVDRLCELLALDDSGGNMHAVVRDWNIEDEHLRGPLVVVRQVSGRQLAAEAFVHIAMGSLTLHERATALAIIEGDLPDPRPASRFRK